MFRKSFFAASLLLASVGLSGCDDDSTGVGCCGEPPNAPTGVFSITGDEEVWIFWTPNQEPDIAGYDVYFNTDGGDRFAYLATVDADPDPYYVDTEIRNGETRYYAVLAFDKDGLESELSFEDIFDTPRPEGRVTLRDFNTSPGSAGFDFSDLSNTPIRWDSTATHVYFGRDAKNIARIYTAAGVDIQDYGFFDDAVGIDGIDWAPGDGWPVDDNVECVEGHGYVIRIIESGSGNEYFAKLFVDQLSLSGEAIAVMDWAYQAVPFNPQLSAGTPVSLAE